jgi:hypothetical protein
MQESKQETPSLKRSSLYIEKAPQNYNKEPSKSGKVETISSDNSDKKKLKNAKSRKIFFTWNI